MAVLATAAALAGVGASAALAAPNEIAYRCGGDICLLDPDNPSAVTNLTDNGTTSLDESPSWSPDGKRVAFVSRYSAGTRNVFVMEPGAAGEGINLATQVTHYTDGGYLNEPVWSRDGTKIAFVRGVDESNRSVLVAGSDGTTGTPVTIAEHGEHPTWAPDDGKIAYAYAKNIYLKNADGTGVATMLENGAGVEPVWSPDGSRIAFGFPAHPAAFVDLHIVSSTGGGTPVIVPSTTQFAYPAWSPDGSEIAYRSTSGEPGYVRVVNADGSGDHPLASLPNVNVNSVPSWSPDGARVVVYGNEFGSTSSENIWVANTSGSGTLQPLTAGDAHEPDWRPNPIITPQVPIVTPSNGSAAPIPPTIKPNVVWITKRIPWTPGQPVFVLSVGCGGITCGANAQGAAKYAAPAGRLLAPPPAAAASTKPKKKPKKPKAVVVGTGKVTVPAGQTRPLMMSLNGKGAALIKRAGHLDVAVTVTITSPGQPNATAKKTIHLFYKPAKKKPKHR